MKNLVMVEYFLKQTGNDPKKAHIMMKEVRRAARLKIFFGLVVLGLIILFFVPATIFPVQDDRSVAPACLITMGIIFICYFIDMVNGMNEWSRSGDVGVKDWCRHGKEFRKLFGRKVWKRLCQISCRDPHELSVKDNDVVLRLIVQTDRVLSFIGKNKKREEKARAKLKAMHVCAGYFLPVPAYPELFRWAESQSSF